MMGPETVRDASAGSLTAGTTGFGCAGAATGAAALVTAPTGLFSSPHPAARSAALSPIHTHCFRMPPPSAYQPSKYQIFAYTHKNGLRKNTYPAGYHPVRTLPRPSMPG